MFRGIRIKFQGPVVKRFIAVVLVSTLAANALAAIGADESFEVLAEKFVSDLPTFSPVGSTWIGDHSADSELDEVDADARDALKAAYKEYLDALADIDRDALSRANQVDFELLSAEVRSRLWSLETLQEWAWNPLYFVNRAGSSIYNLVARDFAPVEDRLGNAAIRLEQFPRFLEQARASIEPERVPKIHAETAVAQNLGVVSIIETMIIPEMGALTPATRARVLRPQSRRRKTPWPITRPGLRKNFCPGPPATFELVRSCSTRSSRSRLTHR